MNFTPRRTLCLIIKHADLLIRPPSLVYCQCIILQVSSCSFHSSSASIMRSPHVDACARRRKKVLRSINDQVVLLHCTCSYLTCRMICCFGKRKSFFAFGQVKRSLQKKILFAFCFAFAKATNHSADQVLTHCIVQASSPIPLPTSSWAVETCRSSLSCSPSSLRSFPAFSSSAFLPIFI